MIPRPHVVVAMTLTGLLAGIAPVTEAWTRSPIQARLVEAYTMAPLAGVEVVIWEGIRVCMSLERPGAGGACTRGRPECAGTLAELWPKMAEMAFARYATAEAACPPQPLSAYLTRELVRVTTDEQGWFATKERYPDGIYALALFKDGYLPQQVLVELPKDLEQQPQWPLFKTGCSVTGRVTYATGEPAPGAVVSVIAEDFDAVLARRRKAAAEWPVDLLMAGRGGEAGSGDDGTYCIEGLHVGSYEVSVKPPAGVLDNLLERVYQRHKLGQRRVTIAKPAFRSYPATATRDYVLPAASLATAVHGRVVIAEDGRPVVARLTLQRAGDGWIGEQVTAYSAADGTFTLRGMTAGKWQLSVEPLAKTLAAMYSADVAATPGLRLLPAERYVTIEREGQAVDMGEIRLRRQTAATGSGVTRPASGGAPAAMNLSDAELTEMALRAVRGALGSGEKPGAAAPPARIGEVVEDPTGSCKKAHELSERARKQSPNITSANAPFFKDQPWYPKGTPCSTETQYKGMMLAFPTDPEYDPRLGIIRLKGHEISNYLLRPDAPPADDLPSLLAETISDLLFQRAVSEVVDPLVAAIIIENLPGKGLLKWAGRVGVLVLRDGLKKSLSHTLKDVVFDAVYGEEPSELHDWRIQIMNESRAVFLEWTATACYGCDRECTQYEVPGYEIEGDIKQQHWTPGHVIAAAELQFLLGELSLDGVRKYLSYCGTRDNWLVHCYQASSDDIGAGDPTPAEIAARKYVEMGEELAGLGIHSLNGGWLRWSGDDDDYMRSPRWHPTCGPPIGQGQCPEQGRQCRQ
ncbi:MAG: carboxypeptidase regulatory-like domain-containing protein [Candidatus Schekmanbacteria bacterium]|nr:carboxypeptidase regulatory-like domain-containing protein [Candidatus Schekmanbacteria bacterium]